MLVGLVAAAAVAVLALVALVVGGPVLVSRVSAERERSASLGEQLERSAEARATAERRAEEAEGRAALAEQHAREAGRLLEETNRNADEAEQGAREALLRAEAAERRALWAEQRAEEANRRAEAADDQGRRSSIETALWELERLRLEREWRETAGPSTALPMPWDGTIAAALAVELELIREQVGTATHLEPTAESSVAAEQALPPSALRVAGELLRHLARVSDEIVVSVLPGAEIKAAVTTDAGVADVEADVVRLASVAEAVGGRLELTSTDQGLEARLSFSGAAPAAQ
jgi:hypothetical protein